MAYRNGEYSELCGDCRELAGNSCRRCGSPLCDTHAASESTRCFGCELGYLSRESRAVRMVVISLIIVGAIVGVFGALAAHAARNGLITGQSAQWAIVIVPVAVAFLAGAFMMPALITRIMRAKFLAERHASAS